MRFGNWRGVTLALGWTSALSLAFCCLSTAPTRADGFHTIPRLVPGVDLNTGEPYYAPPIPYGHYAGKNYVGHVGGRVRGVFSHFGGHGGGCGACGGSGCGLCGGKGGHGGGLFHHGDGGCGNPGCGSCGGGGGGRLHGGHGHGGGLFHHGGGSGCGLCGGKGCGSCAGHASTVVASGQGVPTAQAPVVVSSPQCGDPGCGLSGTHHRHGGCGLCGGKGCGSCATADPCGGCGGKGCGLCGGGKGLCKFCGGLGCKLCAGARGVVAKLLGHDKIKWFVGPGGPVPLTPGYTPYVNPVRSPRDFLAFPPFTP